MKIKKFNENNDIDTYGCELIDNSKYLERYEKITDIENFKQISEIVSEQFTLINNSLLVVDKVPSKSASVIKIKQNLRLSAFDLFKSDDDYYVVFTKYEQFGFSEDYLILCDGIFGLKNLSKFFMEKIA